MYRKCYDKQGVQENLNTHTTHYTHKHTNTHIYSINMTIIGCFLLWQDMHCFANKLGESAHFHLLASIVL